MLVSYFSFNSSPLLSSIFKSAAFWLDTCPQSSCTDSKEALTLPPKSGLQWPPWTQRNLKHHFLHQDPLFFLLPFCWLHVSPLGDTKNHGECRNKATRFSSISPKDLSLSAACSLPQLLWHNSAGPNMNNVGKSLLEQRNSFCFERSLREKPPCCPSTLLALPFQRNRATTLQALTGSGERSFSKFNCEQCVDRMKSRDFAHAQLGCCRNEKLTTLFFLLSPSSLSSAGTLELKQMGAITCSR